MLFNVLALADVEMISFSFVSISRRLTPGRIVSEAKARCTYARTGRGHLDCRVVLEETSVGAEDWTGWVGEGGEGGGVGEDICASAGLVREVVCFFLSCGMERVLFIFCAGC